MVVVRAYGAIIAWFGPGWRIHASPGLVAAVYGAWVVVVAVNRLALAHSVLANVVASAGVAVIART